MATPTLITTVGSASANSYNSLTDARTHFQNRLDGERWTDASEERQGQALLTAMRLLEGFRFVGRRVDTTQALEWPREANTPYERGGRRLGEWPQIAGVGQGLYDQRGRFYASTAIPAPVKDAQCEIAYAMLLDPSLNDPALCQAVMKTDRLTIDHSKPAHAHLRMAWEALSGLLLHGAQLVLT